MSCWLAFEGHWQAFQRLGAFGVAVAVAYYAAVRLTFGALVGSGLRESLAQQQKTNCLHADQIFQNAQGIVAIGAALALEQKRAGIQVNAVYESYAAIADELGASSVEPSLLAKHEKRIEKVKQEQLSADRMVAKAIRSTEIIQLFVLVLATLQWGFGDMMSGEACALC